MNCPECHCDTMKALESHGIRLYLNKQKRSGESTIQRIHVAWRCFGCGAILIDANSLGYREATPLNKNLKPHDQKTCPHPDCQVEHTRKIQERQGIWQEAPP